ncbi:PH domain-containing protein [Mucilaginibacter phyllosphaerae]|uniref:Uncharacterized protein YyaB-like PH domain-containing protein n=1 Tax=Mucilaginibacter phyllosphaerae TaxID=1812349 RepID=A0A4Y8AIX8_9SPHI|nr:PH domain-containing protein [Mucilaginibacter phyllosphaerae]MBB3967969.1 hypothetical protein [Mucilaginibacter phyllosphaerae]TEW69003.1 hypothetical protein E2R65_02220 [Mucilaginibacter phyllosphaerae]GGH02123.1 hypothetical protein GCM10007352_04180 [Mucilaginibacter phyllosphaerae]
MVNINKDYPSKRGFIVYVLLAVLIVIEISYFFNGLYLSGILCLGLTGVIVFPIVFNTHYTIYTDGTLSIKCGFFVNLAIPVADIKKIAPTNSILSAPALSLDRLELFYGQHDSVVISPVNKDDFIAELQNINPAIGYIPKAV